MHMLELQTRLTTWDKPGCRPGFCVSAEEMNKS